MKKIQTLTIGIPAYNEETNIGFLLRDLLSQKIDGYHLVKIIIASDGSTDETVMKARSFRSKKVVVLDGKERKGKSERQNEIISKTQSDILVLLDADIVISDRQFLNKLVTPILDHRCEMTSSALSELPTRTFFEKVLGVSMQLKTVLFNSFKDGNNVYNCHGPARAFSKKIYSKLVFYKSDGEDMFSYLFCIQHGYRFNFVKSAFVEYQLPSSAVDHYKQSKRYLDALKYSNEFFGDQLMKQEFNIGLKLYVLSGLKSLRYIIPNFGYVICYLGVLLGVNTAKVLRINVRESWIVSSSKTLHI